MKYGKICSKHPELDGLRTKDRRCPECRREYYRTPEHRAKEKVRNHARHRTPEYRAKENARRRTPEHRAKRRFRERSPEHRAKRSAWYRSAEYRAKKRAWYQTSEHRAKWSMPEHRARIYARIKAKRLECKANGYTYWSTFTPHTKVAKKLRVRLRQKLKRKSASTLELTGASFEFVIKHLAAQFPAGSGWTIDGLGKQWEIDHRIPLTAFDLDDPVQQRMACHWTNLQPLAKADNIRKSNRFEPLTDGPDLALFWFREPNAEALPALQQLPICKSTSPCT